jgi:hypothetical protein
MSVIRSTIGESKFSSSGARRYVVPSEEEVTQPPLSPVKEIDPAMVQSMRQQAQERQEQTERRSLTEARRRIDIITGLGRRTKEVPVDTAEGKVVFVLRTLKTFEQRYLSQVIEQSEKLTTSDGRIMFAPTSLAKVRVEALAHSLFLIDGQSIDIILGTANAPYDEQVIARKELIEEMDHALIQHLYNNYEKLTQETYDGYMPKTADEAKEVVETISKSGQDSRI